MTLRKEASHYLRTFESFVTLRRLQHEGLGNAFRRWRLWSRVLDLPPVETDEVSATASVEVHLVCCQKDYLTALWALKSFYFTAAVTYPLIVHMNGHMTATAQRRMRRHLPKARLLLQSRVERTVTDWLDANGCPRLRAVRANNGFMLKLVDVNLLSEAQTILLMDSDVLFFKRPEELVAAIEAPLRGSLFQRDAGSTYNITEVEAREELGIPLAPGVNTGIALFDRQAVDLHRCEQLLQHPGVARPTGWIEQTLYALVASEQGNVRYLPPSYLVTLEPHADLRALVARHYAGPSRPSLTLEGIPFALEQLTNGIPFSQRS